MGRFEYREFEPRAELSAFVGSIWRLDAVSDRGDAREIEPILPDGCVEWILHFGDPFEIRRADGSLKRQESHLIAGPSTRPTYLMRGGESHVLGVRFLPGAARILGLPSLDSMVDRVVEVPALELPRLTREWKVIDAIAPHARLAHLERCLLELANARRGREAAALLSSTKSPARVAEMARELRISTRTLERRFAREVGLSPSELRAVERFRRALERLESRPDERLADIAFAVGYSDEPHFCREFRRFAETTPAAYRRRHAEMTQAFAGGEGERPHDR